MCDGGKRTRISEKKCVSVVSNFSKFHHRAEASVTQTRFHTVEKHFQMSVRFCDDHFWTSHFWQPRLQIQRLRGPVLEHFFGTFFFGKFSKSMSLVVEGLNKNHRYFRKVSILAVSDSGEMIGSRRKWSKLKIYPSLTVVKVRIVEDRHCFSLDKGPCGTSPSVKGVI